MAPRAVAIFDFDCTLAADEVSFIERERMRDRAFGGEQRIAMLAEMLQEVSELGVLLAICSLNSRDTIQTALQTVGLLSYFRVIADRSDWERNGRKKSQVISRVILPQCGGAAGSMLFVDDDPANIKDVQSCGLRMTCILVRRPLQKFSSARGSALLPNGGIRAQERDQVVGWARALSSEAATSPAAVSHLRDDTRTMPPPSAAGLPLSTLDGPCPGFIPKQTFGPLKVRCVHCGEHVNQHVPREPR